MERRPLRTGEQWAQALAEFPAACQDIYFTAAFHQAHRANGDGEPDCTLLQAKEAKLLIPGLRVPIPGSAAASGGLWDFQSCNGFAGPLACGAADRGFLEAAWEEWRQAMFHRGGVAALFRLHPLLQNECWLPANARMLCGRQTVMLDLRQCQQESWRQATSKHRNMVSKGRRQGVRVCWNLPADWPDFECLYRLAMERLDAPPELCFSPAYFAALRALPGVELACIRTDQGLHAGSVFLFGARWGHYHLAARQPEAGNYLGNCLLQAAIERASALGLTSLHLGGGRSAAPEDSLLKFKRSLGGQLLEYKMALVMINADAYHALCTAWAGQNGRLPQWLLGYREPAPAAASAAFPDQL